MEPSQKALGTKGLNLSLLLGKKSGSTLGRSPCQRRDACGDGLGATQLPTSWVMEK